MRTIATVTAVAFFMGVLAVMLLPLGMELAQ